MNNDSTLTDVATKYGDLITKVSREVAFEFRAEFGRNAYGYEVASADDIEQRLYVKLAEEDITVEVLDGYRAPQASLRLFARNAANREVEVRHRKPDGRGLGHREAPVDLSPAAMEQEVGAATVVANSSPSAIGIPLADMLSSEFDSRLTDVAEDILSKVPERSQHAAEAYYLRGLEVEDIAGEARLSYEAAGKRLQRGRRALQPDEVASLLALRAYFHPDAKRPARMKNVGTPTALLDLLT